MLDGIVLFLIAVLPVILIGLFVYLKDNEKEPMVMLAKLFIFGMVSCFPIALAEMFFDTIFSNMDKVSLLYVFFYSLFVVGMVEEICKWWITYKFCWDNENFNYVYDAIVYAIFVSLGFAFVENLLYVTHYGIGTGIVRAIMSVPGHASWGLLMGYYLGKSKLNYIQGNRGIAIKNKVLSYVVPVSLHTVYNFLLFSGSTVAVILCLIQVALTYIICIKKVQFVSQKNEKVDF